MSDKKRPDLKPGDVVVATDNYEDEQLGHFAPTCNQIITETKEVPYHGTSGLWVKTDKEPDWVDAAWFKKKER